jgi:hypothetical protein
MPHRVGVVLDACATAGDDERYPQARRYSYPEDWRMQGDMISRESAMAALAETTRRELPHILWQQRQGERDNLRSAMLDMLANTGDLPRGIGRDTIEQGLRAFIKIIDARSRRDPDPKTAPGAKG